MMRSAEEEEDVPVSRDLFVAANRTSCVDEKTPLVYNDPATGQSFRFILHRKNVRKADIYACARCKARRKYVRIMVHHGIFLRDPASLDHICHLSVAELKKLRLKREMKGFEETKLVLKGADTDGTCPKTAANLKAIKSKPPRTPRATRSRNPKIVEQSVPVFSQDDSVDQPDPQEEEDPSEDAVQVDSSRDSPSQPGNEPQNSEQEPAQKEKPAPARRNESFLDSVQMAVESLPENNREKAYVDILHYIYTKIFRRYRKSAAVETNKSP